MKNMNALIDKSIKELENMNNLSAMVGNRPHYPMFVLQSNKNKEYYERLRHKMAKMWPQTVSKIVFSSYNTTAGVEFVSIDDEQVIGNDEMKIRLDQVKMSREIFAEMKLWNIYNVIDTSIVTTLDEFKALYNAVEQMREVVIDNARAMLIVLLDDSSLKRELAKEIKAYIANASTQPGENSVGYDGTFVISNRTYNSEMYDMEYLYAVAANVIVLSNNDATSSYDDNDYAARLSCFYNNHVNTVSYSLFERPGRKIVMQMINTFLQYMQERANHETENVDINVHGTKLGITDKVELCEEFLKKINYRFNISDMEYLPMRSGEQISNLKLDSMNYAQLRAMTFEGVIEQFIENYYNSVLLPEVNISQFLAEYENDIKNRVAAPEGKEITEDLIENLFMKFENQQASRNLPVATYVRDHMYLAIKQNVLYPACKEKLTKLRKDSEETLNVNKQLYGELISSLPVDGFDEIGTMYKMVVEAYLRSEKGRVDADRFLRAGNGYEEMLSIIFDVLCNIIQSNKAQFSLPFIEEWEKRLNLAGEVIYREIHEKLDKNSRNNIHLFGNFPVEEKLQIYMLHTGDARGLQKTDLFTHLEMAYNGVTGTQFFNTGMDDSLEVLKIFDCDGEKLLW